MLLIAWYTDNCVEVQRSGKSKRARFSFREDYRGGKTSVEEFRFV